MRALKTPAGIQKFLDELPYNLSYTARSPKKVLDDRTASCLEGGIFGAAALRVIGFPPLIFDLEAEQDTDHVVAIFKVRGHWGAVAKSNFTGCRYREPVYRTLRELAMSYFNIYFNLRGERTLRRYSRPVNLARFDHLNWMTTEKPVWFIAEYLCDIPHISLLTPAMEKNLTRVDRRTLRGEMLGHRRTRDPMITPSRLRAFYTSGLLTQMPVRGDALMLSPNYVARQIEPFRVCAEAVSRIRFRACSPFFQGRHPKTSGLDRKNP